MKFPESIIVVRVNIDNEEYFSVHKTRDEIDMDAGTTQRVAIYQLVGTETVRRTTEVVE